MADHSNIEWTDATWNPTTGCTKVSPGCANCYIVRTPAFRIPGRKFVKGSTDLRLHEDRLVQPLRWRKPRRIFVNSLSDLFHEDVPDAFIDRVVVTMMAAHAHTFQVLTKRAARQRDYWTALVNGCHDNTEAFKARWDAARQPLYKALRSAGDRRFEHVGVMLAHPQFPLRNLWTGTSVENQHFADERIPLLLQTPAAVRFISAEPLLGAIDLTPWLTAPGECVYVNGRPTRGLDWVIVGGES